MSERPLRLVCTPAPEAAPYLVEFQVLGTPAPQGSKNSYAIRRKNASGGWEYTGQTRTVDQVSVKRPLKPWRSAVKAGAVEAMAGRPVLLGPLVIVFTVVVARPKGHHGTGRNAGTIRPAAPLYPHVMPDLGKFQRAIEDSLTGTVWKDDAQVVQSHGAKVYPDFGTLPEAGVAIMVWPLKLTHGGEL